MKSMSEIANGEQPITEEQQYNNMIALLEEAKKNGTPIDEGLFGAIFGGLAGATAGPAVGKGLCKVLGLDEKGMLGNLLTSKMFLTALGGYLGWKI